MQCNNGQKLLSFFFKMMISFDQPISFKSVANFYCTCKLLKPYHCFSAPGIEAEIIFRRPPTAENIVAESPSLALCGGRPNHMLNPILNLHVSDSVLVYFLFPIATIVTIAKFSIGSSGVSQNLVI